MKTRTKIVVACCFALVIVGLIVGLRGRGHSYPLDPRLVKADNDFAFKLFREVVNGQEDENIFISPASAALALQMTYNGAGKTTKEAMAKALSLQGMTLDEVNRASAGLTALLTDPGRGVRLNTANSLWANGAKFKPEFLRRTRDSYDADAFTVQGDPSRKINAWVSRKTKGKITEIAKDIDAAWMLLLMNAVYFKGQWATRFDPDRTKDGEFTLANGETKTVPFMHVASKFEYMATPDFQAVRLPYGKGRFSMYVFLPDRNSNIGAFLRGLSVRRLEEWIPRFHRGKLHVALPRFEIRDFLVDLKGPLQNMGMGIAFGPGADFSAMTDAGVFIVKVKQKTYVKVNEEGTEAAAVTVVAMGKGGGGAPPFVVDRPFFFVIRDDKSGLILFMGQIVDPAPDKPALGRR